MTSALRTTSFRVAALAAAVAMSTSCRLGTAGEPSLTGPSAYGVSITVSATPDLLQRDGRTTSTIVISAFDASSKPLAGLGLHLDLQVDGGTGGLGTLSQTNVTTGADGRATLTYTTPLRAPLTQLDDATVQIFVTPVGTTGSSASPSSISLRLVSPDLAGGPTATFTLGPKFPKIGDTILFDASASQPSANSSIVTYAWDFGDGNAFVRVPYLLSPGPTITHEYSKSGTFTVGLSIVDSNGKRATTTYKLLVADQ
jgi:PKD repeat protein